MHNIWEGRKMVEAARKHNKLLQVGFQNRSIGNVQKAMKFLHDGGIGDVYMAKGLCYKPRDSFGRAPDSAVPEGVHYDIWIGRAEFYPYNEKKFHYNWHWFWNTGNGDIGNQGPHQFDIARWGMNKNEHPVKVSSHGGYYKWKDCDQQTANTQMAQLEYADGKILQFEVRGLYTNGEADYDVKIGNLFYGTEGWMEVNGSNWKTYMGRKNGAKGQARTPQVQRTRKKATTLQPLVVEAILKTSLWHCVPENKPTLIVMWRKVICPPVCLYCQIFHIAWVVSSVLMDLRRNSWMTMKQTKC